MSEKINRLNKQEQDRNNKTELDNIREAGMCVCAGAQGTGKTYQTMHTIKAYIKDKIDIKVKGRKVLIYDTNGEYTQNQFERNNIPNFQVKSIAIRDVGAWSRSNLSECRRIDAKDLGICLKKVVAFEGEPALHDVLDSHPDKLILLEKFSSKKDEEHKSHDGSKCGCSSVEKHYMNFNGNAESQTNKSTRDISYFILASALLLASAIIVKK
jgi:hypothetical protein